MILTNRLATNPLGLFQNFDRLFNQAFRELNSTTLSPGSTEGVYDYESDDAYVLRLEIPGFSKDEISLSIEHDEIVIKAEASGESPAFAKSYEDTFSFPDDAQTDAITAKLENGILELTLPKQEVSEPAIREIAIN